MTTPTPPAPPAAPSEAETKLSALLEGAVNKVLDDREAKAKAAKPKGLLESLFGGPSV